MSADTPANVGPITVVADSGPRSFRDDVWDSFVKTTLTMPCWLNKHSLKSAGELFSNFVLSKNSNVTVIGEAYRFQALLQVLYLIYWLVVLSLSILCR
jgi:hypothetical protein